MAIVLLIIGGSGLTWSGLISEMFLKESVLVVDGFNLISWFFLKASVWDTIGVIAVMLLLVSALESTGFWLIPGICLQVVVFDWFGSILDIVFPTSALVCEVLTLEILWKVSVFILGSCGRTSGTL